VSHDSSLVALASAALRPADTADVRAGSLGVDVMRLALPRGESLASFIDTFAEQLAPAERAALAATSPANAGAGARLERFFRLWTLKEAYTKALGAGLGFDFARLACELDGDNGGGGGGGGGGVLRVDGVPVCGWEIRTFALDVRGERYVGAVAKRVGGEGVAVVREVVLSAAWVRQSEGGAFVEEAVRALGAEEAVRALGAEEAVRALGAEEAVRALGAEEAV
jgi:4'-phosphopantetheinyl transferase